MLAAHMGNSSNPDCLTSDLVLHSSAWGSSRKCPKFLSLCTLVGNPDEAPSSWPHSRLESKPGDGRSFPLHLFTFQINQSSDKKKNQQGRFPTLISGLTDYKGSLRVIIQQICSCNSLSFSPSYCPLNKTRLLTLNTPRAMALEPKVLVWSMSYYLNVVTQLTPSQSSFKKGEENISFRLSKRLNKIRYRQGLTQT